MDFGTKINTLRTLFYPSLLWPISIQIILSFIDAMQKPLVLCFLTKKPLYLNY